MNPRTTIQIIGLTSFYAHLGGAKSSSQPIRTVENCGDWIMGIEAHFVFTKVLNETRFVLTGRSMLTRSDQFVEFSSAP